MAKMLVHDRSLGPHCMVCKNCDIDSGNSPNRKAKKIKKRTIRRREKREFRKELKDF